MNQTPLTTDLNRFSGSISLISGGTGALGEALVDSILQKGGNVAFTYASNSQKATAILKRWGSDRTAAFQCDVRDHDGALKIVAAVCERWGRIDSLINNASIVRDGLLIAMSLADWTDVLDTTLLGSFALTKPAISRMLRQRRGSVVNIASISAIKGRRGQTNYSAAKAGLLGFTRSLAVEVAPHNIRVNAVLPGLMNQGMTSSLSNAQLQSVKSQIPLRRFGSPQEIAHLCMFLLSEDASYITGQCIAVDGGLSAL
jgi:3-oxoacyl-[acyl-carrier protein] reductase